MNEDIDPAAQGAAATDTAAVSPVETEVRAALSGHVLDGRVSADVGHVLLAALTVFVFWPTTEHGAALIWLVAFAGTAAARALHRKQVVGRVGSPDAIMSFVRRDVWIAAMLWGGWALIHAGAAPKDLAILLLIFAGLIAAATSTLIADTASFVGFMVVLLVPLAVAIGFGDLGRDHLSLLLLMGLFAPFMVVVHRRAHGILVEQIRSAIRERMSEEETARSLAFLNALLASAPSPIVVLDAEGRMVRANPAFERVLGHTWEEVAREPFLPLVTGPRERGALEAFLSMVKEGRRTVADLPLLKKDGSPLWMSMSGTMAHGTAEGLMILVGEDVTGHVEARDAHVEARRQAEQAARAKSSFLASMSHEIRTPMNGILGMLEILLDTSLTEDQRRIAEVIRASGQGLLRILNDVLDVSKIEAGQLDLEEVDFDLPELINEVVRMFPAAAAERGTELLADVSVEVPRFVRGDPHRIRQVLTNLLGNAVKFTDEGEVVLSAHLTETRDGTHGIRFAVRDTGIGIPAEKQEAIFGEFEQADSSTTRTHGGTGLGLSISRRLVEMMGGRLEVDSEVGVGSEFHFTLDLLEGRGAVTEQRKRVQVDLRDHRFLVVDDNATARRIAREALVHVGAFVAEAEDVPSGLEALRDAKETGTPFDAVILDHMMPGRDGFDFAKEVHEDASYGPQRILMVTSASLPGGAARAREVGIGGYLSKPASRADLIRALGTLLQHRVEDGTERRLVTRESMAPSGRPVRILLAEDNLVNQQVAVALLKKRGHDITAVPDGQQALEAVEAGEFDLVLMDIQMPVMDGREATRRIRELSGIEQPPIIALTAHAFAEERERCRAAGMNDFLAKPFKPDDLYDLVTRWTAGGAEPEESEREDDMTDPQGATPPVDIEGFRAIMREAGVEEIVDTTIEIYRSEAPQIFASIQAAVDAEDTEAIRKAAHSLKSSSGNIRANRLAELLQSLENLGRDGDIAGATETYADVRSEYEAVMQFLGDG